MPCAADATTLLHSDANACAAVQSEFKPSPCRAATGVAGHGAVDGSDHAGASAGAGPDAGRDGHNSDLAGQQIHHAHDRAGAHRTSSRAYNGDSGRICRAWRARAGVETGGTGGFQVATDTPQTACATDKQNAAAGRNSAPPRRRARHDATVELDVAVGIGPSTGHASRSRWFGRCHRSACRRGAKSR